MDDSQARDLRAVIAPLTEPALAGLAADLEALPLGGAERGAICDGLAETLTNVVVDKAIRLLLVELNAARVTGVLTAPDPAARWSEWVDLATGPGYWGSLAPRYPTFLDRLTVVIDGRRAAALALARRFAADRAAIADSVAIATVAGGEPELTGVSFGAGDSHQGGHTVAIVRLAAGTVVYKPRPVGIDVALGRFLREVLADEPPDTRIRVPGVVVRPGYGWAEHIDHRYCVDDAELRSFYRGLGHWLAVTGLLSASDLHSENLIAAGPVPVVVDCETFFTPTPPAEPSGYGDAMDRAVDQLRGSALRTGLLPGRGGGLGQRGADVSGAGALPTEQPRVEVPTVVDLGTDLAALGRELIDRPLTRNGPSEQPRLMQHWPAVVDGFAELTDRLAALDRAGRLEPLLEPFRDCEVRMVLRDTVVYAELGAMLWHPAALHNEPAARARAAELLARQAENAPAAPGAAEVIDAEIGDLLVGDVPLFAAVAGHGALTGPGGVTIDAPSDLVTTALHRWRDLDPAVDSQVIACAVISAYRDEETTPADKDLTPAVVVTTDLDRRRRAIVTDLIRSAVDRAVRGTDGTVTWTAPGLGATGLSVQPLVLEVYNGLPGVAMLLGAYRNEVAAGRADDVAGSAELLADVVRTITVMDAQAAVDRLDAPTGRPDPAGAYVGVGSRIWGWLALGRLGVVDHDEAVGRAADIAGYVADAVAVDEFHDVLIGMAGPVVPLVRLAEATGDARWLDEAVRIGELLEAIAVVTDEGARWPGVRSELGLGGFAHGAVGIAWALTRLADATDDARFAKLAEAGFAFQETLWSTDQCGWIDLRKGDLIAANWCHGGDGVGIVAADLIDTPGQWHDVLRRAALSTWTSGFGVTHTLCHGDLGSWEVLDLAIRHGVAPPGVTREAVDARVLSGIEEFGPRAAVTNHMFRPGLLSGMGGMAYELLRMHPDCPAPSLLLPDPALT